MAFKSFSPTLMESMQISNTIIMYYLIHFINFNLTNLRKAKVNY